MSQIETESNVLQLALSSANAGTFLYQASREHLSWDDRSREIFGVTENTFQGHWSDWAKSFKNTSYREVKEAIEQQLNGGEHTIDVKYVVEGADGVRRSVRTIANVIRGSDNKVLAVSGIHVDISEKAKLEAKLRALKEIVDVSPPSDSPATVSLQDRVLRECAQIFNIAARYGHQFSIVKIELDEAAEGKKNYTPAAQRSALVQISQCIESKIRNVDIVARYGATQFLLLLPETNPRDAETVAFSLRRHINNLSAMTEDGSKKVTCSFGVAGIVDGEEPSLNAIFAEADKQLLNAKNKGGNNVSVGSFQLDELVSGDASLSAESSQMPSDTKVSAKVQQQKAANHGSTGDEQPSSSPPKLPKSKRS